MPAKSKAFFTFFFELDQRLGDRDRPRRGLEAPDHIHLGRFPRRKGRQLSDLPRLKALAGECNHHELAGVQYLLIALRGRLDFPAVRLDRIGLRLDVLFAANDIVTAQADRHDVFAHDFPRHGVVACLKNIGHDPFQFVALILRHPFKEGSRTEQLLDGLIRGICGGLGLFCKSLYRVLHLGDAADGERFVYTQREERLQTLIGRNSGQALFVRRG